LRSEFTKVLKGLDRIAKTNGSDYGQRCVAKRCQRLCDGGRSDSASVLAKCHVPDAVKAVLNAPVCARKAKQSLCIRALSRQAGDRVHGLSGLFHSNAALADNAANLTNTRPSEVVIEALGAPKLAVFDPPVAFRDLIC